MTIQFNKETGTIVSCYPEYYGVPPKIRITERKDKKVVRVLEQDDFDYAYISPDTARRYQDPRKEEQYNIYHRKMKIDKNGEPKYLLNKENKRINIIQKKEIKEFIKGWNETVKYVKTQNPDIKLKDGLRFEGVYN